MDYQHQIPLSPQGLTNLLPKSEQVTIPKSMPENPLEVLSDRERLKLMLKVIQAYAEEKQAALELYRPTIPVERFHSSRSRIRLLSGPNRAGKTVGAMAELTRLFAGKDPHKKRADHNLRMYSVGKDEKHLADPMLLKILWPGAFPVIIDEQTGMLRAVMWDPANPQQILPSDMARRAEWKPAPAFLTEKDVTIRWQKRGMGVPSKLEHKHNGSIWQWFTSMSDPRQGGEVDVFHCDEEVEKRGGKSWITEGQMRTADRMGIQVYSFTPQAATPEYFEMHKRAVKGEPGVEEFRLTIDDNPFIPAESKRAMYEDLKHDPDELEVRYYGGYAIVQRRVFPQYDPEQHRVEDFDIAEVEEKTGDKWMRILIVDPGVRFHGVLFLAVPPTEDSVHAYAEIYQQGKTARQLAEAAAVYVAPYPFEAFVIDMRAGRQTPLGNAGGPGVRICDHYAREFKALGLECSRTGSEFEFGSDDVDGREGSIKRWLTHKPPLLKIHRRACPVLDSHLQNRQFSKADPRKRDLRQPHDMTDMLGYGCAWFDPYLDDPSHPFGLFYAPPSLVTVLSEQEERDQKIWSAFLREKNKRPKPDRAVSYGQQYRPSTESLGVQ